jgi:hypothetical protein
MKMKQFISLILLILFLSCNKSTPLKIPTLSTSPILTSITEATSGGNITSDGGATITARGVVWSTSTNPTIALTTKTSDTLGLGKGVFTSLLIGLNANTKYYVRAYATNSVGTAYGSEVSFNSVAPVLPTLITNATTTQITTNSATSGGNITSDGGATITARGVVWSTSTNPTIALTTKTSDGSGNGSFTSIFTGLNANTIYYVRAYATNNVGTAYGAVVSFTTSQPTIPKLSTTSISQISNIGATGGGNITSDGGAAITLRGIVWSTTPNPIWSLQYITTDGTGTGSYTSLISKLTGATKYYVRAYAKNSIGDGYGEEVSFTTLGSTIPNITSKVSSIYSTGAIGELEIINDGGSPITAKGICWSTSRNPTLANFKTVLPVIGIPLEGYYQMTTLTLGTTYYLRSYATNAIGTAYGNEVSFTTKALSIGDNFGGGKVAYIDKSGIHGLIVATADLPNLVEWSSPGLVRSLVTNTGYGFGKSNTTKIVEAYGFKNSTNYAAFLCDSYGLSLYGDWFLPSSDELSLIQKNINILGGFKNTAGYWSSSVSLYNGGDIGNAYVVSMNTGTASSSSKTGKFSVRPVRSF